MSAWAEWKHGMMSEDEYIRICNEEARRDECDYMDEEDYIDDESDE